MAFDCDVEDRVCYSKDTTIGSLSVLEVTFLLESCCGHGGTLPLWLQPAKMPSRELAKNRGPIIANAGAWYEQIQTGLTVLLPHRPAEY